jgi:DNA end-binding protein Ku
MAGGTGFAALHRIKAGFRLQAPGFKPYHSGDGVRPPVSLEGPRRLEPEARSLGFFMPSSVWTGYLTFGLISMPVRLFSGARGSRVSFHMLHRDDLTRIKQQLFCPHDERVVERSEIVKGYEYRKGEYVVIEPEEIKKIEPKTAKAMEILEFVKSDEIDPIYFETSYCLVPEEAGRRPYVLLVRALEETGTLAIAKLTMHNREYTVILRPYKNGILLHTMYYADEVRQLENSGQENVEVREGEVKIAHQLIQALQGKFQPEKFHDTFEDNLKALIKAHLEGKEVTAIAKPKPAPVTDLMAALKQSLAQMEKKKPVERVTQVQEASRAEVTRARARRPAARKRRSRLKATGARRYPAGLRLTFRIKD